MARPRSSTSSAGRKSAHNKISGYIAAQVIENPALLHQMRPTDKWFTDALIEYEEMGATATSSRVATVASAVRLRVIYRLKNETAFKNAYEKAVSESENVDPHNETLLHTVLPSCPSCTRDQSFGDDREDNGAAGDDAREGGRLEADADGQGGVSEAADGGQGDERETAGGSPGEQQVAVGGQGEQPGAADDGEDGEPRAELEFTDDIVDVAKERGLINQTADGERTQWSKGSNMLGEGCFAVVFRRRIPRGNVRLPYYFDGETITVAVKLPKAVDEAPEQIYKEIINLRGLGQSVDGTNANTACRFIVRMFGALDSNSGIVMEFYENGSWADDIEKNPLQTGSAIFPANFERLLWQILDLLKGISHMVHCFYLHNDIKIDNCLISRDGRLRIADLGGAKCIEFETSYVSKALDGGALSAPGMTKVHLYDRLSNLNCVVHCVAYAVTGQTLKSDSMSGFLGTVIYDKNEEKIKTAELDTTTVQVLVVNMVELRKWTDAKIFRLLERDHRTLDKIFDFLPKLTSYMPGGYKTGRNEKVIRTQAVEIASALVMEFEQILLAADN